MPHPRKAAAYPGRSMDSSVACHAIGSAARYWAIPVLLLGMALAADPGTAHAQSGEGRISLLGGPGVWDVGGHWVIEFTYDGGHDLVVSGANGTELGVDLEVVGLRDGLGGEFEPSGVRDDDGGAVTFAGFGIGQGTGYLAVQAYSPGTHNLRLEFGGGVVHASNYAAMANVVSPGGDAAYGYRDAVRVDVIFSGPVVVDLRGMVQGAADAEGGIFDSLADPVSITTMAVNDRIYALVAGYASAGVQVVDMTDPASPVATASIFDDRPGRPTGFGALDAPKDIATIQVDGRTYALVANFGGHNIQVIDMTDPASPVATASIFDDRLGYPSGFDTLASPNGIATIKVDGRAYALVTSFLDDGVQVIDMTDPANPAAVASILDDRPDNPTGFETLDAPKDVVTIQVDGRAYALVTSFLDDGVQVIDMTDPANPAAVASILDDRPDNPTGFETLDAPEEMATVRIDGRTYLLVTSFVGNGVQVIDVTNPYNPAAVGSLTWGREFQPSSVEVVQVDSGYYALVATSRHSQFAVFDITDPYNPYRTAMLDRTGHDVPFGQVASVTTIYAGNGVYALLADRTGDRVHLLDISDPSVPEAILLPCLEMDISMDPGGDGTAGARHAIYESGNGTDRLSFVYTPRPGDASDDLGYAGRDALAMNGHRLVGIAGAEITPLLPEPGEHNSLRFNHQIVVDTLQPSAVSAEYSTGTRTLEIVFSEPLNGTIQYDLLQIRDGDGGPEGTAVSLAAATSGSVSNGTVAIVLSPPQRSAITGMASPLVDIQEGAVWDAASNPAAAMTGLPVTIRDDPQPTTSISNLFILPSLSSQPRTGTTNDNHNVAPDNTGQADDLSDAATITLIGSSSITLVQGHYTDDGATCTTDDDSWHADPAFTGTRRPSGYNTQENQVFYYYTALGEYTITYTCGPSYSATATRTVTIEDAPPKFDWSLWPEYCICVDITDGTIGTVDEHGTDHGVLYPVDGVYTCIDSHGHTITATGPP